MKNNPFTNPETDYGTPLIQRRIQTDPAYRLPSQRISPRPAVIPAAARRLCARGWQLDFARQAMKILKSVLAAAAVAGMFGSLPLHAGESPQDSMRIIAEILQNRDARLLEELPEDYDMQRTTSIILDGDQIIETRQMHLSSDRSTVTWVKTTTLSSVVEVEYRNGFFYLNCKDGEECHTNIVTDSSGYSETFFERSHIMHDKYMNPQEIDVVVNEFNQLIANDYAAASTAQGAPFGFGAISYADLGHGGWAFGMGVGYDTQQGADDVALEECRDRADGQQCDIVERFRNRCAAMAASYSPDDGTIGWGVADTSEEAEELAVDACEEDGALCLVDDSICG